MYALDDLAVDCLLGAEALYAEPSAYNLVTSNPWWQLGKDKFEVVTVANSEATVNSVLCFGVIAEDGRPLTELELRKKALREHRREKQRKGARAEPPSPHLPSATTHSEALSPDVGSLQGQLTVAQLLQVVSDLQIAKTNVDHQSAPVNSITPPNYREDEDIDPGAKTIHASLKVFDPAEARPHVIKPKTGAASVLYSPDLPIEEEKKYRQLVEQYRDCFANSDDEIGINGSCELRLFTHSEDPVTLSRRIPYHVFPITKEQVSHMLTQGWVRKSN